MHILIADDDINLRRGLADLLELEGFDCSVAGDGAAALAAFRARRPDFCILDIMMPCMDGLELCRVLRREDDRVPILLLTARDQEIDRVIGLEIGADDYVSKPYGIRELVARIRAIQRRCGGSASPGRPVESMGRFRMDDLDVDPKALRAFRGDRRIDLTRRDVAILSVLHARMGEAVSRNDLYDLCWGRDYLPNSHSLDQYVSALRRKIERDAGAPRIIRSVYGVGYRHDPDAD
ncbi:response regulator transcription factor [Azospirillum sp. Sh1]|uniref:response regulator transcription factor n=1 Tax=Azospirillum sp. Sh1 TaxID=2607285 RepID=UPI0011EF9399|nr:response regulator transcription factor [Azospirillum sp. Sh1]KAA0569433.1 response regulator transcription factor [Azospirillum sp. Sh1]